MKRSPILRRSRIRWKPPRRRAKEAVFDPYVHWLTNEPNASCVVCGTTQNIQGSHVGIGGMGLKHGRACDMVRMCGPGGNDCHGQWEQKKLYFAPENGWTWERRRTVARQWRLKSWHDYLGDTVDDAPFGAPEHERCAVAIAACIDYLDQQQETAA